MDFSITGIGPNGVAQFGTDAQTFVKFYRGKRANGPKSREAGATVYDDVDMVMIVHPGEKDAMHFPVTDEYKRRWPQQFSLYQQGREAKQSGVPLDLLFPDSPATVSTMNALHIFTVEQLAGIPDSSLVNIPMGLEHVKRAKAYLDQAKQGAGLAKLAHENDELRAQINRMQEQIDTLSASQAKAQSKAKEAA